MTNSSEGLSQHKRIPVANLGQGVPMTNGEELTKEELARIKYAFKYIMIEHGYNKLDKDLLVKLDALINALNQKEV